MKRKFWSNNIPLFIINSYMIDRFHATLNSRIKTLLYTHKMYNRRLGLFRLGLLCVDRANKSSKYPMA